MKIKKMLATAVLVLGTSLTASAAHVSFGINVGTPPPPLVAVCPVGVAPGPGYVWVDGYWDWVGGKWVWVPGRWVLPPRPHAVWVVPHYHPYHDHYHYHRGYWR
jgi:hypothetical protein